jgi:hypothetical protein
MTAADGNVPPAVLAGKVQWRKTMYTSLMVNAETKVRVSKGTKHVRVELIEPGGNTIGLLFNNQDQVHTLVNSIQGELDPVPEEVAV